MICYALRRCYHYTLYLPLSFHPFGNYPAVKEENEFTICIFSPEVTSTSVYFIFILCLAPVVRVVEVFWREFLFSSIEKTDKYFLFHHSSLIRIATTPTPHISCSSAQPQDIRLLSPTNFIMTLNIDKCISPVLVSITCIFASSLDITCGQEKIVLSNGFLCQSFCLGLVTAVPLDNIPLTTYKEFRWLDLV